MILTLRITDEDHAAWRLEAGRAGLKLSEWVRRKCGAASLQSETKSIPDAITDKSEESSIGAEVESLPENFGKAHNVSRAKSGLPPICPHHKQRGELCYKCDPKFGLPVITTGQNEPKQD